MEGFAFFNNKLLFGEDILNALHVFAGSWLDYCMIGLTMLGYDIFYIVFLSIIFWCHDRAFGVRLVAVFIISVALNALIKDHFMNPRPDPANLLPGIRELNMRHAPSSPGFPSGHAQTSLVLFGIIAYLKNNHFITILCASLILLIPYSRLYLAVHYLGDVLGGFIIGGLLLALYIPGSAWIEKKYRRFNIYAVYVFLIAVPLLLQIAYPDYKPKYLGFLSGFVIGYILSLDRIVFSERTHALAQLAKIVLGLAGIAAFRGIETTLLPAVPLSAYFTYWLIGIWISFFSLYLFSRSKFLRGM